MMRGTDRVDCRNPFPLTEMIKTRGHIFKVNVIDLEGNLFPPENGEHEIYGQR